MPWGFAGYGRGLNAWILENVDAIHAIEFSVRSKHGFAGTADALLEIQGMAGPCIVDWKTTQRPDCPDYALAQYKLQMSAYSIGVEELTGLRPAGACIVVARKSGPALVHRLNADELAAAADEFKTLRSVFPLFVEGSNAINVLVRKTPVQVINVSSGFFPGIPREIHGAVVFSDNKAERFWMLFHD